jgi:hypothetical protein
MGFKTFISESIKLDFAEQDNPKVKAYIEKALDESKNASEFQKKLDRLSLYSADDMKEFVGGKVRGSVDWSGLRQDLREAGTQWLLMDVPVKLLKVQDAEIVKTEPKSKDADPIVVVKDYNVIDGRHRVLNHKKKTIRAFVPSDIYYKLNK